ncbi:hypothetical protein Droror1_Dr00012893 [Drosera rotundifolia]
MELPSSPFGCGRFKGKAKEKGLGSVELRYWAGGWWLMDCEGGSGIDELFSVRGRWMPRFTMLCAFYA